PLTFQPVKSPDSNPPFWTNSSARAEFEAIRASASRRIARKAPPMRLSRSRSMRDERILVVMMFSFSGRRYAPTRYLPAGAGGPGSGSSLWRNKPEDKVGGGPRSPVRLVGPRPFHGRLQDLS